MKLNESPKNNTGREMNPSLEKKYQEELAGKLREKGGFLNFFERRRMRKEAGGDLEMARMQDERAKLMEEIGGKEENPELVTMGDEDLIKMWQELTGREESEGTNEMKMILQEVKRVQEAAPSMEELVRELGEMLEEVAEPGLVEKMKLGIMNPEMMGELKDAFAGMVTRLPEGKRVVATAMLMVMLMGAIGGATEAHGGVVDTVVKEVENKVKDLGTEEGQKAAREKAGALGASVRRAIKRTVDEERGGLNLFNPKQLKKMVKPSLNFALMRQSIGEIRDEIKGMGVEMGRGGLALSVMEALLKMSGDQIMKLVLTVETEHPGTIEQLLRQTKFATVMVGGEVEIKEGKMPGTGMEDPNEMKVARWVAEKLMRARGQLVAGGRRLQEAPKKVEKKIVSPMKEKMSATDEQKQKNEAFQKLIEQELNVEEGEGRFLDALLGQMWELNGELEEAEIDPDSASLGDGLGGVMNELRNGDLLKKVGGSGAKWQKMLKGIGEEEWRILQKKMGLVIDGDFERRGEEGEPGLGEEVRDFLMKRVERMSLPGFSLLLDIELGKMGKRMEQEGWIVKGKLNEGKLRGLLRIKKASVRGTAETPQEGGGKRAAIEKKKQDSWDSLRWKIKVPNGVKIVKPIFNKRGELRGVVIEKNGIEKRIEFKFEPNKKSLEERIKSAARRMK